MNVTGSLDRCDAGVIAGWVLFPDDPGRRARLEIHAGDMFFGTCVADIRRQDLVDGGVGDGHCAFRFTPPRDLPDAALLRIVIRIVGTDFVFRAGLTEILDEPLPAVRLPEQINSPKRFRIAVLHIGTEKTGTTSLQAFFALNRQAFAQAGYFIPLSLAPHSDTGILNHIHLATYAMDDTRFEEDMRGSVGVHDADGLQRYRQAVRTSFEDEIAALDPNCDVMILSNEHCHSRLFSPREIHRLKAFLEPYCDQFEIVVYLRPQHELAMSLYGMAISNGILNIDMFPPLPPPPGYGKLVYTTRRYFDYYKMLVSWLAVFGEESIIPRLYTRDQLRNQDIIDDFMYHIPLVAGSLLRPDKMNSGVSADAQRFLINFYQHFDDPSRPGAERVRLRVRNALRARFPGNGTMPARAEVAAFLEQFEKPNEQVRMRWFPDREELFDVDLSRFPETATPTELSAAELYPILIEILFADQDFKVSLTHEQSLQPGPKKA